MKKKYVILVILGFILLVSIFFFPKNSGITPSMKNYRYKYSCLGFEQEYVMPNTFDAPLDYKCYGVPYNKKCYEWELLKSEEEILVSCDAAKFKESIFLDYVGILLQNRTQIGVEKVD